MKWGYLLLEILPTIFWILGHMCEKNSGAFPNIQRGYRHTRLKKNAKAWLLGNKLMGNSLKFSSTMLIMLNLLFFFGNVSNIGFVILLNGLLLITSIISANQKIIACIDEDGIIKKINKENNKLIKG